MEGDEEGKVKVVVRVRPFNKRGMLFLTFIAKKKRKSNFHVRLIMNERKNFSISESQKFIYV